MTFRTAGRGRDVPHRILVSIMSHVDIARDSAVTLKAANDAGTMRSNDMHDFLVQLSQLRTQLASLAGKPGLDAEAQRMFEDPGYHFSAESHHLSMVIDSLCMWFEGNFPRSPQGHLEVVAFVGDGTGQTQGYTMAANPDLSLQLQGFIERIQV